MIERFFFVALQTLLLETLPNVNAFEILALLILFAIYGAAILAIVALLGRLGLPSNRNIVLSFLAFGSVTGIFVAWLWPRDIGILVRRGSICLLK